MPRLLDDQIVVRVASQTGQRLRRYKEKHLIPLGRIIKRLLALVPWWRDDETQVVLSIKKPLLADRAAARAAMIEAIDLALDQLSQEAE